MNGGSIPAVTARLPKLCGADIEVGNFVLGASRPGSTGCEASRALLAEIDGLPRERPWPRSARGSTAHSGFSDWRDACGRGAARGDGGRGNYDAQDWGRKFLPENGGCVYIDLDHLELCLPEVLSAWDHVAAWHAMLRIARGALDHANACQPEGRTIQVLVNNSDGQGNSYGSHLDFLITRRAWDNIFRRKVHQSLYLATYQVSSIVFTGQGKAGAENGAPPVAYQLSQRADFFETLLGPQTTYNRPIVNSRDEPLCGQGRREEQGHARLHVIFFDSTLAHVASLLKVGVTQIVLAMVEAEHINPDLILDDPVEALVRFSHDPTLKARARMTSGEKLSAVELQLLFLEEATKFVASGGCDGIVTRAREILALWEDTLVKLQAGDLSALARRLDWVLKLQVLQRAMARRPGLGWHDPQVKHLDLLYSSLDAAGGLYWIYERNGLVERLVTEAEIGRFVGNPPDDTRAWSRAMLLRHAGSQAVEDVDWDSIRFKIKGQSYWPYYRTLDLPNPLAFTRAAMEPLLREGASLDQVLDALEATWEEDHTGSHRTWRGVEARWAN